MHWAANAIIRHITNCKKSKNKTFNNRLCDLIFKRVLKLERTSKKPLPNWLVKLSKNDQTIKKFNKKTRARLTNGMTGSGFPALAFTIIPELIDQGVHFLKKGLALNKEAELARRAQNARIARQKRLDKKYLEIIKRTRKPLV